MFVESVYLILVYVERNMEKTKGLLYPVGNKQWNALRMMLGLMSTFLKNRNLWSIWNHNLMRTNYTFVIHMNTHVIRNCNCLIMTCTDVVIFVRSEFQLWDSSAKSGDRNHVNLSEVGGPYFLVAWYNFSLHCGSWTLDFSLLYILSIHSKFAQLLFKLSHPHVTTTWKWQ